MGSVQWGRANAVVGAIVALFFGLYYNCAFCAILPWLSYSVPGVVNLAVLTVATSLSLVFFLTCVVVDPGGVPADWRPDEEDPTAIVQVKKTTGGVRFCQKCQRHKPPRAHHCRVCKRCILRMDHHCPWINNCVGHHNYKAFLLFLLFAIIALIHSGTVLAFHQRHTMRLIHGRQDKSQQGMEPFSLSSWGVFIQVVLLILTFVLAIALVSLMGWHIHLVVSNKTTIEYHEGVTAKLKASKMGRSWEHPYDVGLAGNLAGMFGDGPLEWLQIRTGLRGTGTSFLTILDDKQRT